MHYVNPAHYRHLNRYEKRRVYRPLARQWRSEGEKLKDIARNLGLTVNQAGDWCKGVACPVNHSLRGLHLGPRGGGFHPLNNKLRRHGFSFEERKAEIDKERQRIAAQGAM